jgi:hypothetical protein
VLELLQDFKIEFGICLVGCFQLALELFFGQIFQPLLDSGTDKLAAAHSRRLRGLIGAAESFGREFDEYPLLRGLGRSLQCASRDFRSRPGGGGFAGNGGGTHDASMRGQYIPQHISKYTKNQRDSSAKWRGGLKQEILHFGGCSQISDHYLILGFKNGIPNVTSN